MPLRGSDDTDEREDQIDECKQNEFCKTVPGEAQPPAPGMEIILRTKEVATDVARVLEIARVDDVVRTIRTGALPFGPHRFDITRTQLAQPEFAKAGPG